MIDHDWRNVRRDNGRWTVECSTCGQTDDATPCIERCRIQWVDSKGNPTPDRNDAIGYAWRAAHTTVGAEFQNGAYFSPESEHFPICAEHARRMVAERLSGHHWCFIARDPASLT